MSFQRGGDHGELRCLIKGLLEGARAGKPGGRAPSAACCLKCAPSHILDATSDPEYGMSDRREIGGYRSVLGVPLMREGMPIGVLVLGRNSVRAFTDGRSSWL